MEDKEILDLYFAREEKAIAETDRKYGAYCYSVANRILGSNEDSEEMLQLVFDSSAYDLGTGIWSADTKNKYVSTVLSTSKTDIASRTEKIRSGIEAQLEKFMTALEDLS